MEDNPRLCPTKLEYYEDMFKLQSTATVLCSLVVRNKIEKEDDDGRQTLILDSTIFHPQGGGQPSDTGFISNPHFNFVVQDVRSIDKIVYHYGYFDATNNGSLDVIKGVQVYLNVDEARRTLNSRLHSAGHLIDICVRNIGWGHLEPTKGYHFADRPFVEYKGVVPPNELQSKQKEIELEVNKLISIGGKVSVIISPYDKASELCGGYLPGYIPKDSTPRVVKLGESPGCPCGGTHVNDISDILNLKLYIYIYIMIRGETIHDSSGDLKVSFGYHCNNSYIDDDDSCWERERKRPNSNYIEIPYAAGAGKLRRNNNSFSCLSGAALSANATLANTNICNGLIGSEILPTLDSPNSFRRIPSSPSFSTKLDFLSSSLQSSFSNMSFSPCSPSDYDSFSLNSMSAPSRSDSFLNAMELQIAGGAAGEDRVQAVCSEENGWLFCAIYDGFNGRDAADFLAGTLYETIAYHLNLLDLDHLEQHSVLDSLKQSLHQAENEFLHMVEQEMEDRPDLVSIGSCVLLSLLHGKKLYLLNVGDSRAVLATYNNVDGLEAVQLTDSHTVDNEVERIQLLSDHLDDPCTVVGGKVKGKLKVTRAFGVGYLKKKNMNDALMGILRVNNLISPPYVSLTPSLSVHEVSDSDNFVVLGSDGLFDFFSNDEVVNLVHSYILTYPFGDPAKYLVEKLAARAADSAGFTMEELMSIPAGRRRKYHDDVTVIVIFLGTNKRTSKASTFM